jgi:hypothetical protein
MAGSLPQRREASPPDSAESIKPQDARGYSLAARLRLTFGHDNICAGDASRIKRASTDAIPQAAQADRHAIPRSSARHPVSAVTAVAAALLRR